MTKYAVVFRGEPKVSPIYVNDPEEARKIAERLNASANSQGRWEVEEAEG